MGLILSPEAHIPLVYVPTQVKWASSLKNHLHLQELNFVQKELNFTMEDTQNWCSRNSSFLWETKCWFSGGFCKAFSQILNILRNYGWTTSTIVAFVGICHTFCLPTLATKRWIVLLSDILFLPKSLLHCRCFRGTGFVVKYSSMIFISYRVV